MEGLIWFYDLHHPTIGTMRADPRKQIQFLKMEEISEMDEIKK